MDLATTCGLAIDNGIRIDALLRTGDPDIYAAGDTASMFFHLDPEGRLIAASAIGSNAAIAREIRIADMLIARRATPQPADLGDPSFELRDLLGRASPGR